MNRFKKTSFGLLVAAISVAAFAAQDAVSLKRVAKAGDTAKYRLKADVEVQGTEATFSALVTEKISKVESNGNYVVESAQTEGKIVFGGQEMEAPASTQTFTYKPNGEVVEIKADSVDSSVYRTAHLTSFIIVDKAIKTGDEWTHEVKKDEKTGAVAAKGTYKVEGSEKIGDFETFKIKFATKETEGGDTAAVCEGISWISKKDGTLVKSEGTWKNVPFPGAPGPINAKYSMTREK
jgi:hypothetical protein